MTKDELVSLVRAKFAVAGDPKPNPPDLKGDNTVLMEHWVIPVFDKQGSTMLRQWVHFYVDPTTGEATWQDREPKPTLPPPVLSFAQKVEAVIKIKTDDGTLKYGAIDSVSEVLRRARITVVTAANAVRQGIVSADAQDKFTLELI